MIFLMIFKLSHSGGRHRKTTPSTKRRLATATALAIGASTFGVGTAQAAPAPSPMGSLPPQVLQVEKQLQQQIRNAQSFGVNAILDAHEAALAQINALPAEFRKPVRDAINTTVNAIAPGAIKAREAARVPKPAPKPAAKPAPKPAPRPAAHPCPADAKACVDINGQRAWLQDGTATTYGPVFVATGKPGQETPRGSFTVTRKVKDEISYEFGNAPMPYAVYFTNHGHAFHQGDPAIQSAGCVRMYGKDAQKFFYSLNVGDKVYIY